MSEHKQTLTIRQAINLAVQHHEAGRLSQAESIYQQILQSDPNQPVALHLLGVVFHQEGRNDIAADLITQAIAIRPDYADAHYNLGNALKALGQPQEAVASFRKALDLKPDYAEAHNNLGNALKELGKLKEAVTSYHKALDLKPELAEAHTNLGLILQDLGKTEEALKSCRKALDLNPNHVMAYNNLGGVLHELGKLEEAEQTYRMALKIDPDSARVLINLGHLMKDIAYEHRGANSSELPSSNGNQELAEPTADSGPWNAALAYADRGLSLEPSDTSALALKATALLGLNRLGDWSALCDFKRLVQIQTMSAPKGYANLRIFNEALFHRCANDESRIFEPPGKSMQKGSRINSLHNDPKPSPISALLEFANKSAERYRAKHPADSLHPWLERSPRKWHITAWGSILGKRGYHRPHIHRGGWLSGVYYGILPDVMKTEKTNWEGCIEFGRPKNHIDDGNTPKFHLIRPYEGLMILFPSYFYHQTVPFESDDTRFTVSFDLIPLSW